MDLFKRNKKNTELPKVLTQQDDPVNYNSVLDYLVGLSPKDYEKLLKSSDIYRDANKKVARVLGVKDEPTAVLQPEKPTDEEVDDALDDALNGIGYEATGEPEDQKPKKEHSATKKIEIKDKA